MRALFSLPIILVLVLSLPAGMAQAKDGGRLVSDGGRDIQRIIVTDGSGVHDIGELLLHTGNWGIFGSYPSSSMNISQFPSAEWPAGSGVEHLFIEGIWIGAVKSGIPAVSTAAYEMEFMPTDDPIDIIYSSYEGAPGGMRLPSPAADDDGDGMMDEDYLDGRDNDGDGLIDEDYAAISPQMFSSWYSDNMPIVSEVYPEHNPLDIVVRMETYQWDDDDYDDFVGVKFTVVNVGDEVLEDICFGMFTDPDVGRRSDPGYYLDDSYGHWWGMRDSGDGEAYVNIGYGFDYDGDGGQTTSYYGTMILGTSVEPEYSPVPGETVWTMFRAFHGGDLPFEEGGDPVDDFQRYMVMASNGSDLDNYSGDSRYLLATGIYGDLLPGALVRDGQAEQARRQGKPSPLGAPSEGGGSRRARIPESAMRGVLGCGEDGLLPVGLAGVVGLLGADVDELPLGVDRRDGLATMGHKSRRVEGESEGMGAAPCDLERELRPCLSLSAVIGADAARAVMVRLGTSRGQLGLGCPARDDAIGHDDEWACCALADVAR